MRWLLVLAGAVSQVGADLHTDGSDAETRQKGVALVM